MRTAVWVLYSCKVLCCHFIRHPSPVCSSYRVTQELQDRYLDHPRGATILDLPMVGASMAVDFPLAVVTELLPLEDPMDTPVLEESPLELQADHMAVYLQEVPMVSYLQVPMVPSRLDLMDRVVSPPMSILRPTLGSSQWMLTTVAISHSRS